MLLAGTLVSAELPEWIQNLEASNPVRSALLKLVTMPGGVVTLPRPPRESRTALTETIGREPRNPELFALRARAAEQQLDFPAAEVDWKHHSEIAADRSAALLALADFYQRRLRPADEVRTLLLVAQQPVPAREAILPAAEQTPWRAFERSQRVSDEQALPATMTISTYRAWIVRYPREAPLYSRFLGFLVAQKQYAAAEELLGRYQKAFPDDRAFPVVARASIERQRGSAERALEIYDRAFEPLWPPRLVQSYFALLQQTRHLRDYLSKARSAAAANPGDLDAAARLFYYYQQQGNLAAAQRPLLEFAQRKEASGRAWAANDLWVLGQLFEGVRNPAEAARFYYALYSLPGADAAAAERALAGLFNLLMNAPEQPVAFGSDDLSFYKDVATMDRHPGFLNGILSLILNTTYPSAQYANQEQAATAYFHRGAAAQLLALFEQRFPKSTQRPAMQARLIEAYGTYGDNGAIVRAARQFLASFPNSDYRTSVAMQMADAFARTNQVNEEFATYDALLKELAARAGGVPLGPHVVGAPGAQPPQPGMGGEGDVGGTGEVGRQTFRNPRAAFPGQRQPPMAAASLIGARSPEYARVLDRYISRLVSLKRPMDALALYRREIDRNPNDPGLYERLAQFLEQNRLAAEVEQIYRRAIQQFPERSWYHKLARWYLRQRQAAAFDQLSREVVKIFSGSELESYFRDVVGMGGIDAQLYRQLNEFAHQRFPSNLSFVRNLMQAYTRTQTYNDAGYETLLRTYWYWDDNIKARFFERLSSSGQLMKELGAVRVAAPGALAGQWKQAVAANPAAARFVAEVEAWNSHFEDASAPMRAMEEEFPSDLPLGRRAASLERSLAGYEADFGAPAPAPSASPALAHAAAAVQIAENLNRANPRDTGTLTFAGEVYADRDLLARARPFWNRIPQITPGRPGGYIEAATIFWDYFQFDDALRLIGEARKKFDSPALYAYEAGAIHENKREYEQATGEYVKGAVECGQAPAENLGGPAELAGREDASSPPGSYRPAGIAALSEACQATPARMRLLRLARRPNLQALIDKATAPAPTQASRTAINLRVAVLEAGNRRAGLEQFLLAVVDNSSSPDVLADVAGVAAAQGLERVEIRSYQRQAAASNDPIERMRLRLALARFYESHNDLAAARREFEALYKDNPKSLGIVRATVDFYWRNKISQPAVDTLLDAADRAYPGLKTQLTFEAARKDTEAGRYAQARQLLDALLKPNPFDARYLAAMADTFAREKNDAALRDFYNASIQAMGQAPMDPAARNEQVAALRRGLIPALTRLGDYSGAVDQYIEIVNRYPEDEGVLREAAVYAIDHELRKKLIDYYTQTAARSPRDYRWPMILARIDTSFENFPEAIAAYTVATVIRPDRVDLHAARASLEERLLRFEEAATDYSRLYELAYHDPQWMEKVAEVRARQGRTDAAVAALEKALIEGRPERPEQFFEVAHRLEAWGMLARARQFAERALKDIPPESLSGPDYSFGLQVYSRVMTRLREYPAAFAVLRKAQAASPPQDAYALRQQFSQMARTAAEYFTPEEKVALVQFLQQQKAGMQPPEFQNVLLPFAQQAGLAELEANWLFETMMTVGRNQPGNPWQNQLVSLQTRRIKFKELGAQLAAFWKVLPESTGKPLMLEQAAGAYRRGGDDAAALQLLASAESRGALGGNLERVYFELLLAANPQRLVELAASTMSDPVRTAAAQFAVDKGGKDLAFSAVQARGRGLPPVWTRAYTALAGVYYAAQPDARAATAFTEALGSQKIGDHIGRPLDRDQQLAGDIWFYYGWRYGEYLDATKSANAEDFLPAEIELHPARASAYSSLADYYRGRRDLPRATADYEHALELNPLDGASHTRLAEILWPQKDQAIAHWKQALEAYSQIQDRARAPESFWSDVQYTLASIGRYKVLPETREAADRLLRTYIRRNGTYRVDSLLKGALAAASDPAAGVAWLLELSKAGADPVEFLRHLLDEELVPENQREAVLDRAVAEVENRAAQSYGAARAAMLGELYRWQLRRLEYLVDHQETARASAALAALPQETRASRDWQLAVLEMRIAAQAGTLDALLDRYRREPDKVPEAQPIETAAGALRQAGDAASARKLLDFAYTRELDRQNFTAANFLGLAEIRLETGRADEALRLLRRMTLLAGEPFQTQVPAAALLAKAGRHAEAAEFLAERVRAVPWDAEARVHLAEEQIAAGKDLAAGVTALSSVAGSREAAYSLRLEAAELLGKNKSAASGLGSAELELLARGQSIATAAVEQPFFDRARVVAAESRDPATQIRLLADAIALDPDAAAAVRVSLLHAAVAANQHRLAIGAIEALIESSGLRYRLRGSEGEEAGEPAEPARELAARFLPGSRLSPAGRAAAARDLAAAHQRLDDMREARLFLAIAVELEPAAQARATLEKSLEAVDRELKVRETNARRRPVLSNNLEQPNVVRPYQIVVLQ